MSVCLSEGTSVFLQICPSVWRYVLTSGSCSLLEVFHSVWRPVFLPEGLSFCPSVLLEISLFLAGGMSAYLSILSEVFEGLYDCLEVCSSVWSSLRLSGGLYCPTVCCYIGLSFCLEDLEVCLSVRLSRGFSVWLGKKYVRLEVYLSVWRLSVCPPKLRVSRIEDRSRPLPLLMASQRHLPLNLPWKFLRPLYVYAQLLAIVLYV